MCQRILRKQSDARCISLRPQPSIPPLYDSRRSSWNVPRPLLLLKQHLYRQAIVHPFSGPPRDGRALIYVNAELGVLVRYSFPVRERVNVFGSDAVDGAAIWISEADCAVI